MKRFAADEIVPTLGEILNIEQQLFGPDYVKEVVRNIAARFEVKYVLIGHAVEPEKTSIQTDVVWAGSGFYDNFTYDLVGTPCEIVYSGNRVCVYQESVALKFPKDKLLADISHSICPSCMAQHYPEELEEMQKSESGCG